MEIPKSLKTLFAEIDQCPRCLQSKNPLRHILGGGKFRKPRFLFLFINPTRLNLACHPGYEGQRRYPFIGVKYFYRILAQAGFFDESLIKKIYRCGWQVGDEERVEKVLANHGVYLTNLVKCSRSDSQNPSMKLIEQDLPLLKKEIKIVSPKYIVAFGRLPVKVITGKNLKLTTYFGKFSLGRLRPITSITIFERRYPVLPCWFPVGRGNPRRAVKTLLLINKYFA